MTKSHHHTSFRDTIITFIATIIFVGGPVLVANWLVTESKRVRAPIQSVKTIQLRPGVPAIRLLAAYGFDMESIRQNKALVPQVYFSNLPTELISLKDTKEKKKLFFSSLLPAILKVNDIILKDRKILKKIILQITVGEDVTEKDYYWLTQQMVHYKIKVRDVQDFIDRTDQILAALLSRMNIIPPELALAQAAQESGWGTSRFAQQGNALYGQWTWDSGCGMVPAKRDPGKTHRMKCFKSILEAVDSYVLNLNTHMAYRALRRERQVFRDDQIINVLPLVETLTSYSEEGQVYVEKIKNIIRINHLQDFQRAQLESTD